MKRIGWAALMRLGLVELRLRPDDFWALTPAELALMAGLGDAPLNRRGLAELLERFPDRAAKDGAQNAHPTGRATTMNAGE